MTLKFFKIILIIFLISVLFLIIILEGGLRFYRYSTGKSKLGIVYPSQSILDDTLNYVLNPDYRQEGVTHNSQGFRANKLYSTDTNIIKIICMGSSTTYGANLSDTETFPQIMSNIFNNEKKLKVEVINAGIPAHHSYHILLRLDKLLKHFHPQYVVFYVGDGDLYYYLEKRNNWQEDSIEVSSGILIQKGASRAALFSKRLREYSVLFNYTSNIIIKYYLQLKKSPKPVILQHPDIDQLSIKIPSKRLTSYFYKNCDKMIQICKKNNSHPVFVTMSSYLNPANLKEEWLKEKNNNSKYYINDPVKYFELFQYYGAINEVVRSISESNKNLVTLLDFERLFFSKAGYKDRHKFFSGYLHMNSEGNKMLAQYIVDNICR